MKTFLAGLLVGLACGGAAAYAVRRRRDELLGSFFAFAMHEVNTPLTAVNMTVLNFLSGVFGPIAEDQVRWMEMLRTQTSRLNCIVGELRDMIHFELKRDLIVRTQAVSVVEAVDIAMQSIRNGIPSSELLVDIRLPPGLPDVLADEDRLPRTISSLIFHARKFKSEGPIVLEAAETPAGVRISIAYQGVKISPEEVRGSLELYYPARKKGNQLLSAIGAGLGTLRRLTELQGGTLTLDVSSTGAALLSLGFPKGTKK